MAKRGRMEGGKMSKGVGQARKRKSGLTVYATGVPSMEGDLNSLNFLSLNNKNKKTFSVKKDVRLHVV